MTSLVDASAGYAKHADKPGSIQTVVASGSWLLLGEGARLTFHNPENLVEIASATGSVSADDGTTRS